MKRILLLFLLLIGVEAFAQCYSSVASKGYHNLTIRPDGTLWAWGRNSEDQIGNNLNPDQLNPVQIGIDSWTTLSTGTRYSIGVKNNGTLWGWGENEYGQTGPSSSSIPQMIGTDTDWISAATGIDFTSALKSNGSLWTWGFNNYGQLGNGTTISSFVPAQMGTDSDWVAVSNGSQHVLALKSDGTLWSWGWNSSGQLGHVDFSDRSVPTQVGTESSWVEIYAGYSASAAIKSDGTLWVWGFNEYGMVGDGTTIDRLIPTQVGTDTNWKSVAVTTHVMAIKTDVTLWAWGRNNYGKIGNGVGSGSQLTPVQIGTDTDWMQAIPGFEHSIAIKGNGTVYTWGHNNYGQLGDGTTVDKIIPTQIGTTCTETLCTITATSLSPITAECSLEQDDITIPTAIDSCGDTVTATLHIGVFPITENSTIIWKFGNGATTVYRQQDVVIEDTEEPVPTLAALPAIQAQCSISSEDITAPTAQDNCTGILTATTENDLNFVEQGTHTITWTYNDGHGNTITQEQQVIIDDNQSPVPALENLPAISGQCEVTADSIDYPTAIDSCSGPVTTTTTDSLNFDEQGTYTITWTYNDGHSNTITQEQQVIIQDTQAPVAQAKNITIDLSGAPSVTITAEQVNNGSNDNCEIVSLEIDTDTFTTTGTYNVVLSAADAAGNTGSDTAIITVINSSLDIADLELQGFSLYPIPATDWIYIKKPDNIVITSVEIYDMSGRKLYTTRDNEKINISSLAKASYITIVNTNSGPVRRIIIKQ